MRNFRSLTTLLVAMLLLVSCGGGGGGGSSSGASSLSMASVSVVLTDSSADNSLLGDMIDEMECGEESASNGDCAPPVEECPDATASDHCEGDDGDQLLVTVSRVELLGSDGRQTVFSGSETVNLFGLKDSLDLLFVDNSVTPGEFDKVRLTVDGNPYLVNADFPDGTEVKLPSGHIDFNPRGSFSIHPGDVVTIKLDMDAHKSLKLTANKKKVILRPVVFVDIRTREAFEEGLVRVSGTVGNIGDSGFELCRPQPDNGLPGDSIDNEDTLNDICLDVVVTDRTGLFDDMGEPTSVDQLMQGDPLTVIGLLRRAADVGDDTDNPAPRPGFELLAFVVEGGQPGTWSRARGVVQTGIDQSLGTFDFMLANDASEIVTGQVYPKSRILAFTIDGGLVEIASDALTAGDRAAIEAVRIPAEAVPGPTPVADQDLLRIAIMLVRPESDGPVEPETLRGRLASVGADSLTLATASGDRCVNLAEGARIIQLVVVDDSVEGIPAELGDLEIGALTGVAGQDAGECFEASLVISAGAVKPVPVPLN